MLMPLMSRWVIPCAIIAATSCSGFAAELSPPTPPLLEHARAGGGWWSGGCPPHADETIARPEARSADVEERLATQFPPGTAEPRLVLVLKEQGFERIAPCDNDPQIHRATFTQQGGGFLGPYPVLAIVAWKIDDLGDIIWIKALIAYRGP
jgi:hypothetical protein